MKVIVFDAKKYDIKTFGKANNHENDLLFITGRLTAKSVHRAEGYEAVCTFVNCKVDAEVLDRLSELGVKTIFQRSAGYNNIDLVHAEKLGIQVYRVPAYSPEAVAEYALTLLMSLNRNVHISYLRTSQKNFSLEGLQGDTIFGQTIGVLGAGRIGLNFIRAANGLGAEVIVYDEYARENFPNIAEEHNFTFVDKEEFFKSSDYVSLHAPLLPSTKYIINKETLALMKPSAIIVNTSRGGLINTEDLLWALDHGHLRGAGLDVYEHEEGVFFFDRSNDLIPDQLLNRMRAHRNVILTSHQAFFTNLALKQIAETTMDNIQLSLAGDLGTTGLKIEGDRVING